MTAPPSNSTAFEGERTYRFSSLLSERLKQYLVTDKLGTLTGAA